jgi:NADH-quinone oxidoreductase subunit F
MIAHDFKPILLDGAYQKENWSLASYQQRGGYEAARKVLAMPRDEATNSIPSLIDEVKKSSLRGRGGAGFPAGMKWSFVDYKAKKPRYLAVNCDESEPGTCKDRVIVTYNPHMLLEGILIACHTCGIEDAYIFIRGEYVIEFERLVAACAEAYQAGLIGKNAMGSGHTIHVTPHRGAGAYVCGEETGLLSALEGDRGYPKVKPPFPAVEGAWRCPTVVNNVQTLSLLPSILKMGADEWAKIGPPKSPGPMIYCLSGHVKKPGLYELPMTVTMKEVVYELGGGVLDDLKLKAVIPGGSSMPVMKYDGPYVGSDGEERTDDLDMVMDFDTLRAAGSMLGSAAVIVMHERTCMVNALYNLVRFYHHESCGQCTPCREGSGWVEKILSRIVHGKGKPADYETLVSVIGQMSGTTICLLADSCAMPVGSFLVKFKEEFQYYCEHGKSLVKDPIKL